MSARTPENWLGLLQEHDDAFIARFLLRDLSHYRNESAFEQQDAENVLALVTAIRLQQIGSRTA